MDIVYHYYKNGKKFVGRLVSPPRAPYGIFALWIMAVCLSAFILLIAYRQSTDCLSNSLSRLSTCLLLADYQSAE